MTQKKLNAVVVKGSEANKLTMEGVLKLHQALLGSAATLSPQDRAELEALLTTR